MGKLILRKYMGGKGEYPLFVVLDFDRLKKGKYRSYWYLFPYGYSAKLSNESELEGRREEILKEWLVSGNLRAVLRKLDISVSQYRSAYKLLKSDVRCR